MPKYGETMCITWKYKRRLKIRS